MSEFTDHLFDAKLHELKVKERLMRPVNLKPFVIIALNTGLGVAHEMSIIKHALGRQHAYVKPARGYYGGECESSYLVRLDKSEDREALLELAKDYEQESILYVDNERQAALLYTCYGPDIATLGAWREVRSSEPPPDNCTIIGDRVFVAGDGA